MSTCYEVPCRGHDELPAQRSLVESAARLRRPGRWYMALGTEASQVESFKPREMTASLTAVGHYRIRFTAGTAYFPPANAERFEVAIRRFCESEEAYAGILFHSAQRVFPAGSSTDL
jgi:hypothetical protein